MNAPTPPNVFGRPTLEVDGLGPDRPKFDEMAPPDPAPTGKVASAVKIASRVRTFEGFRGYSARTAVWLRQFCAFMVVLGGSAVSHWALADRPAWRFGGYLMLYSVAFMAVCTSLGTVLYAESRLKIVEQFRHFTFGLVVGGGTAIAVLARVLSSAVPESAAASDGFLSLLTGNGMMLVYFSTVVIPAGVFAKYVFGGVRTAHRNALADEEAMAIWTRQDGRQR